ncbi:MAG: ferritin-like domain-containing protein [candidate division Zixibacteria bacterium]|nr:ferritin-like domain-containing protein [candidate division Zixibacteria bacterium]
MSKLETLHDLLVDQTRDIFYAEKLLTKALPKMMKKTESKELRQALENHLTETENQVIRLESVFKELGISAQGKRCPAMEGLVEEATEIMNMDGTPEVIDAGIICAAQKVEHYEIATYGSLRTFAETLGLTKVVTLFDETLREEHAADEKLSSIAESYINPEAKGACESVKRPTSR